MAKDLRYEGFDLDMLESEYKITGRELVDVLGFLSESVEIIDNLVTGNNRTFKQMVDMGVVVKPVKKFVNKHKKFLPETQATHNQKERTAEAQEKVNADTDIDTIEVKPDNGTLEAMS